jgi:hypothetical protein
MAKKRYALMVRGMENMWSFDILAEPEHVQDWLNDGLEVYEVVNTSPAWLPGGYRTLAAYHFLQDIFHFQNPFKK